MADACVELFNEVVKMKGMKMKSIIIAIVFAVSSVLNAADTYKLSEYVTPDPDADNGPAINAWIKNLDKDDDTTLVFDVTYPVTKAVHISGFRSIVITGSGSLAGIGKPYELMQVWDCPGIRIEKIKLNGGKVACLGMIIYSCPDATIDGATVAGIGGWSKVGGISERGDCHNMIVRKCRFENIAADGDDGAAYGVAFSPRDGRKNSQHVLITDCQFKNISPVGDADGIKFFNRGDDHCAIIQNNTFVDCLKRAIKIQGNHVLIQGNSITGSKFDAIGCQVGNRRTIIGNTIVNGGYYGISLSSNPDDGKMCDRLMDNSISGVSKAVVVYADPGRELSGGIYIDGMKLSNVVIPIQLYCDRLDRLTVPASMAVTLGGYWGSGKSYTTQVDCLRFVNGDGHYGSVVVASPNP